MSTVVQSASNYSAGGTSTTVTLGTAPVQWHTLVAFVFDESGSATEATFTPPDSTWKEQTPTEFVASACSGAVYIKTAGAAEPTTYTFTTSNTWIGVVIVETTSSYVDTAAAISGATGSATTAWATASYTVTGSGELVLVAAGNYNGTTTADPAGTTHLTDQVDSGSLAIYGWSDTTTGTTFTVSGTWSGSDTWIAYAVALLDAVAPAWTADSPPAATLSTAYSYTFAASGTPTPTYAATSGTLPTGLALNSTTGVLSGTPTVAGTYTFEVTATNAAGAVTTSTLSVAVTNAPTWVDDSPPTTGSVGVSYAYTFSAAGTPAPTYSVTSGALPAGLTLDASSGLLSGTPTTAGAATFEVTATNTDGTAVTGSITITVSGAPTWVDDSPPATGTVGSAYDYTFTAVGAATIAYSVSAGALPPGLTLNTSSGAVTGSPTAAGSYSFTITATNGDGSAATSPFPLTITAATTVTAWTAPLGQALGQSHTVGVTLTLLSNGLPLATLPNPVTGGGSTSSGASAQPQITVDATATNVRSLSYATVDPTGLTVPGSGNATALEPTGLEIAVDYTVSVPSIGTFTARVGVFAVTDVTNDDLVDANNQIIGPCLTVTGLDRSYTISQMGLTETAVIVAGTPVEEAIYDLISAQAPWLADTQISLEQTNCRLAAQSLQVGADPWSAAAGWATAAGAVLYFDPTGKLILKRHPAQSAPLRTWQGGAGSTITGISYEMANNPGYNGVIVQGASPKAAAGAVGAAWDYEKASPFYCLGPYGRRPAPVVTSTQVLHQAQAQAMAEVLLPRYLGLTRQATTTMVPDPTVDVYQVNRIVSSRDNLDEPMMVQSFQLPLDTQTSHPVVSVPIGNLSTRVGLQGGP